jgi:hypothetical protein
MIIFENYWRDFGEIWHGHYGTGEQLKNLLFNFLQSVILTWQMHKLMRWE